MVEWLVEKGASIEFPVFNEDRKIVNIVEYAAKKGAFEIEEFLKDKISKQALPVDPNK